MAETIHQKIKLLTDSFETGKALKKGVPVAIVGKTNVGKSTLLNCLLHEEKLLFQIFMVQHAMSLKIQQKSKVSPSVS